MRPALSGHMQSCKSFRHMSGDPRNTASRDLDLGQRETSKQIESCTQQSHRHLSIMPAVRHLGMKEQTLFILHLSWTPACQDYLAREPLTQSLHIASLYSGPVGRKAPTGNCVIRI